MAIDISQMTLKEMVWSSSLLESNLVIFLRVSLDFENFPVDFDAFECVLATNLHTTKTNTGKKN